MIKTHGLTRTYGKGDGMVTALNGVDLTIKDGSMGLHALTEII